MIFFHAVVFLFASFDFPVIAFQCDTRAATAVFPVYALITSNIVKRADCLLELANHAAIDYDLLASSYAYL